MTISERNTSKVLNAQLYNKLSNLFQNIKIHRQGDKAVYRTISNKIDIIDWGECYSVDCPFCGDKRSRLWVSHIWGMQVGKYKVYPAVCYNSNCINSKAKRFKLIKAIAFNTTCVVANTQVIKCQDTEEISELKEAFIPKGSISLTNTIYEPAYNYIRERGFDPKSLAQKYNLYVNIDARNGFLNNRIIIPVYFKEKLVGWTARTINDSSPKYIHMPGMKTKTILFNFDNAVKHRSSVIIVEGVFDVFRMTETLGKENTVCLFGKTASSTQIDLLEKNWKRKVILLDRDAEAEAKELASRLTNAVVLSSEITDDPDSFFQDQ